MIIEWETVKNEREKLLADGFDVLSWLLETKNCQEITMEAIGTEDKWTGIKASCVWHRGYRKIVTVLWSEEGVEIDLNILRWLAVWGLSISDTFLLEPDFAIIEDSIEDLPKTEVL